jgi:hypothetical protein
MGEHPLARPRRGDYRSDQCTAAKERDEDNAGDPHPSLKHDTRLVVFSGRERGGSLMHPCAVAGFASLAPAGLILRQSPPHGGRSGQGVSRRTRGPPPCMATPGRASHTSPVARPSWLHCHDLSPLAERTLSASPLIATAAISVLGALSSTRTAVLFAPSRAGAAHVVQLGPIGIANRLLQFEPDFHHRGHADRRERCIGRWLVPLQRHAARPDHLVRLNGRSSCAAPERRNGTSIARSRHNDGA